MVDVMTRQPGVGQVMQKSTEGRSKAQQRQRGRWILSPGVGPARVAGLDR